MKLNENAVVYNTEETVKELNKVKGFDPMKYARFTENGAVLDLRYQKLWFRLKHPNGKIRLFIQKMSDKISAVEARVYFDRRDFDAASNHIISGVDITDKNAVAQAQRSAIEEALSDAGFGLQFISTNPNTAKFVKESEKNVIEKPKVVEKPKVIDKPIATVQSEETAPTEIKEETPTQTPVADMTAEKTVEETTPEPTVTEQPQEQKQAETQADPLLSIIGNLEKNGGNIKIDNKTGEVIEESNETAKEILNDSNITNDEPASEINVSYNKDTPVEEICKVMSLEDAMSFVIEGGPFNGWKMETLANKRPKIILDTLITKYPTKNNILTAAAMIVRDNMYK